VRWEAFALAFVRLGGDASKAYREAFPGSRKWQDESVWVRACRLLAHAKVMLRVNEIREALAAQLGAGSEPETRIKVTHYGLRVLGAPIGTHDFVKTFWRDHVRNKTAPLADRVRQRLPSLQGRFRVHQSCMVNRGSFMARSSHPDLTQEACKSHDRIMLDGFKKIINEDVSPRVRQILKLPSSLVGLNCAMAQDLAAPAFLAARAAAIASFVDDRLHGDYRRAVETYHGS
jgi:hypothetical protein